MSRLDDRIVAATKPGTPAGKLFYGTVFFIVGLLLTQIGFWKTILIILLTVVGVFVGAAPSLRQGISKLVNKCFPPRNRKVTYSAKDLEKVKKALDINGDTDQK